MLQNYIERWKGKIIQPTKRPAQIKQLEQANVLRFYIICLRGAFELFLVFASVSVQKVQTRANLA